MAYTAHCTHRAVTAKYIHWKVAANLLNAIVWFKGCTQRNKSGWLPF